MNKKYIFLMAYLVARLYAVEYGDEAQIELARKSACFFIKHTKNGCLICRAKDQVKKISSCQHDKDECLKGNLEDDGTSVFYIYDENKRVLEYPIIVAECPDQEYKKILVELVNTLNPMIKPRAVFGQITMQQGKPMLSFYDKERLWIGDYPVNPEFFIESMWKLELSPAAKKQFSNLDLTTLKKIENKTGGMFQIKKLNTDSIFQSFTKLKSIF